MPLRAQFEAAVRAVSGLSASPPGGGSGGDAASSALPADRGRLLTFYSLYSQATAGPCRAAEPPGPWDPAGRAKWAAWSALGSMPRPAAMRAYVDELRRLAWTLPRTADMARFIDLLDEGDGECDEGEGAPCWERAPAAPVPTFPIDEPIFSDEGEGSGEDEEGGERNGEEDDMSETKGDSKSDAANRSEEYDDDNGEAKREKGDKKSEEEGDEIGEEEGDRPFEEEGDEKCEAEAVGNGEEEDMEDGVSKARGEGKSDDAADLTEEAGGVSQANSEGATDAAEARALVAVVERIGGADQLTCDCAAKAGEESANSASCRSPTLPPPPPPPPLCWQRRPALSLLRLQADLNRLAVAADERRSLRHRRQLWLGAACSIAAAAAAAPLLLAVLLMLWRRLRRAFGSRSSR